MHTPEELAAQQARADKVAAEKAEADRKAAEAEALKQKELESIPETLRGKSPKELADMLMEQALETERHKTALKERETELESIRSPRKELTEVEKKALREKELVSDPTSYIDREFDKRIEPLTKGYHEERATIALRLAKADKERYPEFAKYEKGVASILEKMPPETRANPQAIDLAYRMTRYDDLEKTVSEARAKGGLFTETESKLKVEPTKITLSDEEKSVAQKFGLSDEEFVKWSNQKGLD